MGMGRELTRFGTWQQCSQNLQSDEVKNFVIAPDVLSKFSKMGNVFFSR